MNDTVDKITNIEKAEKIYVCGKMSGIPEFNRPAFNRKAEELRDKGYDVFNPGEVIGTDDWSWADYMRTSLTGMLACDTLYVLDGYETSRGANIEIQLAKELGMNIVFENAATPET